MKKLFSALDRFWFTPMPATRIAVIRILSGLFTLWYLLSRYSSIVKMADGETSMFEPVGLASMLSEPLPMNIFLGIFWTTIALNIAYILGWQYRFTGILFAIASLFVFSYRYSWSMIYHDNIAVVLHVLVIALAPAADAYSLDSRKRGSEVGMSWQYGWPIRLLCAATLATYFLSGLAKVYGDLAWAWVDGSAMRSQVAVDSLRKDMLGESATPLFEYIYPQTWLFLLMGLGTMVIELGAPFVLASRKLGKIWAILTWLLHIGIYFVMGITFRYQMTGLIFLPFFDVEKIWPWLRSKLGFNSKSAQAAAASETATSVVLFDGVCNFCNGTVRFIANRDRNGVLHFASQQSAAGAALLEQYGVKTDLSSIVFIEQGKAYQKSTAVLRILRHLNWPWPLAFVAAVLPAPIRDFIYDVVARNRYRWWGRTEECPVPAPAIRKRFL
jgi:predicted DCC family thiol-disulfide oxidoreductase YuxK